MTRRDLCRAWGAVLRWGFPCGWLLEPVEAIVDNNVRKWAATAQMRAKNCEYCEYAVGVRVNAWYYSSMRSLLVGLGVLFALASSGVSAQVYDCDGAAGEGRVQLRAWLPDNAVVIKGVVVLSPGLGGDARDTVLDPAWQQAATRWQFALAGTSLGGGADYNNASSGTGLALDMALQKLAEQSGHPEITHAPLCLAGFSNGGAFSFSYNWYRPERVLAFFCNKSGLSKDGGDRRANETFAVLLYGEKEQGGPLSGSQAKMTDYFHKHRSQGARWALAIEWNVLHEHGNVDSFVRAFFEEAIRLRYPAKADPRKGPIALKNFAEHSGWLGDNASWLGVSPRVLPFASYRGDLSHASWFPNKAIAQEWARFVNWQPEGKYPFYRDWPFDVREATRRQEETATALALPQERWLDLGNGQRMKMLLIPAGRFMMGSDPTAGFDRDESPQHEVLICKPFYLGAYEVTQAQYRAVTGKGAGEDPALPASEVAWYEAEEFCTKISRPGQKVRLPTEAEWEYACRAGSALPYWHGTTLTPAQAKFAGADGGGKAVAAGSYPPNAWGIYDMAGNVWEWCWDWYGDYAGDPQRDPTGPATGTARVIRGGGWFTGAEYCRSASRRVEHTWYGRINDLGFRVVVEIP